MIQSIAWFPSQCALNSTPVVQAMATSLAHVGIRLEENSWNSDAVLIWSVLWAGRMAKNQQVYQHYQSLNRPVVVVDAGALIRNHTWRIAIGHVNAMGYFGHTRDLDFDRPRRLGIYLGSPRNPRHDILIAAQHQRSLQLSGIDQESWIMNQIDQLRNFTDRRVCIRSHPRSLLNIKTLPQNCYIEKPQRIANTYDDFDFDVGYQAVINYSSTPGIQAAIQGTPVIVTTNSLAYPVSIQHHDIESPPQIDREQWLIELCHTEYLVEEIEQGTWLKRLYDKLC